MAKAAGVERATGIEAPARAEPRWESWDCGRCGARNGYRSFCTGCRAAFEDAAVAIPVHPAESDVVPQPATEEGAGESVAPAAALPVARRGRRPRVVVA